MRTLKLILAFLLFSSAAMAQSSRATISYDVSKLSGGDRAINIMGSSVGYSTSFCISQKSSLDIELGAKLSYGFYGLSMTYVDTYTETTKNTLTMMSLSLPINISYTLPINDKIELIPYAGLSIKANVLALATDTYVNHSYTTDNYEYSYNMLSDVDTTESWSIAQLGAQVGIGMNISRIYVGLCYYQDLTELSDGYKFNTLSVNVGLNF